MVMEWSIQEVARLAGTTSRTLRHYDERGIVPPSRVGANGYRYYDANALLRLQRVLVLRGLGLGIPVIARILRDEQDDAAALADHLRQLRAERDRLARQIITVESTLGALERGESPMAESMFEGFDHTVHRAEVEQRWGADAFARSDAWWRGLGAEGQRAFGEEAARLQADWLDAANRGEDPSSAEARALADRHVAWLAGIPGTPGFADGGPTAAYVLGLADMYVADPRFAAAYGGDAGARFVRAALRSRFGAE
jgi:DNA-binding transcriptional MerR regulator